MIRRPWLAPLLLLAVSGMAWAQEERILSYHSDIAVRPDASMRVTLIANCGNVALNNGLATCTTSSLSVGSHSITATYGGSSTFNPSTSPTFSQTVNPG